jgi:hypothetical protein
MHRLLVVSATALAILSAPTQSKAAEACKASATVTVTGVILFAHLTDDGWSILADNVTPCDVSDLVGRGTLPPDCIFSKTLQATGVISADSAKLNVQTIACS